MGFGNGSCSESFQLTAHHDGHQLFQRPEFGPRFMSQASHAYKTARSAAVVITTKNRMDDLRKAVISALSQTAEPEVLVLNDGSTDGTAEMLASEFPEVSVQSSQQSLGLIAQRNRGARLVAAPIVFSIDDDAVFSSPRIVDQTLAEFDHPRVGAVAIPFIDVNQGPEIKQLAPDKNGIFAAYSFIGTAHALRRELFLSLNGYREVLFHQGEEEDFCVRMLNEGYIARSGTSDPIHHFESPRRSWERMDYYGSRNKVLYTWQNVPFPYVIPHLMATSVKTLTYNLRPRRLRTRLRGLLSGYANGVTGLGVRQPVLKSTYRLSQELKSHGPMPLSVIENRLPKLGGY